MVHQFKLNGYCIAVDSASGAIHVLDDVAYDIVAMYKTSTEEESSPPSCSATAAART